MDRWGKPSCGRFSEEDTRTATRIQRQTQVLLSTELKTKLPLSPVRLPEIKPSEYGES